jgi:hypothetical protein
MYSYDWQEFATECPCGNKLFRLDEDESPYRTCIICGQQLLDLKVEE